MVFGNASRGWLTGMFIPTNELFHVLVLLLVIVIDRDRETQFDYEHEHHPPRRIEHERDKEPKRFTSKRMPQAHFWRTCRTSATLETQFTYRR
jgi:hypothetical protein